MNPLEILFILKFYPRLNIFGYIVEKYQQEYIKLARRIEERREKIAKVKCDIILLSHCRKKNLIQAFMEHKVVIRINLYPRNK